MKCVFDMTKTERVKAAKDFLSLHQSSTEECQIDFKLDDRGIVFFPKHGSTFHCGDKIVKFAQYYNSYMYFAYDGEKVIASVF
jgi:hypothetical protein